MKVYIGANFIRFDDKSLSYSGYYFQIEEWAKMSSAQIFKKMVEQWVIAIERRFEKRNKLYLPILLDDQFTDCLRVEISGNEVSIDYVRVAESAWRIQLDSLDSFINSEPIVTEVLPDFHLEITKDEFVEGLRDAAFVIQSSTDQN